MKIHPVSISSETHGLAGSLALPESASAENPVPGAVILGGPGPVPLQRYTAEGPKNWPMYWAETLARAGLACLCYDQRGSGLSSGLYHEANWDDLCEDARAAVEMLALQPEVRRTVAIAWADGTGFALNLAAEGKVDGLILLSPGYLTAEARYAAQMARLAASRGLSDRVVQLRVSQWRAQIDDVKARVARGQETAVTDVGGQPISTNLRRFLSLAAYDPSTVAPRVTVPALLLHGADDTVIPPAESEQLAAALSGPVERREYPGQAHFIYRSAQTMADAAAWMSRL